MTQVLFSCGFCYMQKKGVCKGQCETSQPDLLTNGGTNPNILLCCCLTLTDSVKLCVMGIFAELYLVIPLSLTETLFQGHYSVKR